MLDFFDFSSLEHFLVFYQVDRRRRTRSVGANKLNAKLLVVRAYLQYLKRNARRVGVRTANAEEPCFAFIGHR